MCSSDLPKNERPFSLPAPLKMALSLLTTVGGLVLIAVLLAGFVLMMAYPSLPDIDALATYQPAVTTRIHAGDGSLLAEYSRERRLFLPNDAIPERVKQAFIAAEDKNFYKHPGVDIEELLHSEVARELPTHQVVLGVLLGLRGSDVIEHHGDAIHIVQLGCADLLHHADGAPRGRVAHHQVGECLDDFAGLNTLASRLRRENLLRYGLSQAVSVPRW